jgi:hypothetical protein
MTRKSQGLLSHCICRQSTLHRASGTTAERIAERRRVRQYGPYAHFHPVHQSLPGSISYLQPQVSQLHLLQTLAIKVLKIPQNYLCGALEKRASEALEFEARDAVPVGSYILRLNRFRNPGLHLYLWGRPGFTTCQQSLVRWREKVYFARSDT